MGRHVNEECWTLVGRRRGGVWFARAVRRVSGEPVRVAFDAAWALEREERRGDLIGFLHTHPTGALAPSGRDVRTMSAWCSAFGKPLLCLIARADRVAGYRFGGDGDGTDYVPLAEVQRFPRGVVIGVDAHGRQAPARRAVPRRRRAAGAVA
jgi:proteasome lid subunit RPN8/RPN11